MIAININLIAVFIWLLVTMVTYEIGMDVVGRDHKLGINTWIF